MRGAAAPAAPWGRRVPARRPLLQAFRRNGGRLPPCRRAALPRRHPRLLAQGQRPLARAQHPAETGRAWRPCWPASLGCLPLRGRRQQGLPPPAAPAAPPAPLAAKLLQLLPAAPPAAEPAAPPAAAGQPAPQAALAAPAAPGRAQQPAVAAGLRLQLRLPARRPAREAQLQCRCRCRCRHHCCPGSRGAGLRCAGRPRRREQPAAARAALGPAPPLLRPGRPPPRLQHQAAERRRKQGVYWQGESVYWQTRLAEL